MPTESVYSSFDSTSVLVCFSVVVIEHLPKAISAPRVYFSLQVTVYPEGKPKKEFKERMEEKTLEDCCLLLWLA